MSRTLRILGTLAVIATVASCAAVLGLKQKIKRRPFEHRAHVLKGINCGTCHVGVTKAGETGKDHLPGTAKCMSCHKKPHNTSDCRNCHGSAFARERVAMARKYLRFKHSSHMPRVKGNCVRCHSDVAKKSMTLLPRMATCFNCHPHKDQFKVRNCNNCHINLPEGGMRPSSHVVHDSNFVRRHGTEAAGNRDLCSTCHGQKFCAQCHGVTTATLPARMYFDRTMKVSVHRANFFARHAFEARGRPGLCSTCHQTSFCADCHADRGVSAVTPFARGGRSQHGAGWVGLPGTPNRHGRAARTNPIECASCHGGSGEALCIGCHKVGGIGGNPHPPGYSSRLRKHRDLPCRLCHGLVP